MVMGACPGQIPMPCVPPTLMATATVVRACRYNVLYLGCHPSLALNNRDTRFQVQ